MIRGNVKRECKALKSKKRVQIIDSLSAYLIWNVAIRRTKYRTHRMSCVPLHIRYVPKKKNSRCRLMKRNGSFRSRLIIFRYPFLIRLRSVHIFRPFWIPFNLFPCCAICFSAWQFMILIKERACMLFNWKNGFQRLHQKMILFYRAKGSHAHSHHTHARSHHAHAQSHTSLRFAYFLLLFLPPLS